MPDFGQVALQLNDWLRQHGLLGGTESMLYGHVTRASAIGIFDRKLNIHLGATGMTILARAHAMQDTGEAPHRRATRNAQMAKLTALRIHLHHAALLNVVVGLIEIQAGYHRFTLSLPGQRTHTTAQLIALFQDVHGALIDFDPQYVVDT